MSRGEPTDRDGGAVVAIEPLGGMQWPTVDPFLLCVRHEDDYPPGNAHLGPDASLRAHPVGDDFEGLDGWRMYHGREVPGFPAHPHRGFETITLVETGFVDHADSLGWAARYGAGDVQWLTAGAGLVHSEMFPLLDRTRVNPLRLFQIWLNLPRATKMAPPRFEMFWAHRIPRLQIPNRSRCRTVVTLVAGPLRGRSPPAPPPDSWAAERRAQVAIWVVRMAPGARFRLPEVDHGVVRSLYFYDGSRAWVEASPVTVGHRIELAPQRALALRAGPDGASFLLLQGRPLGEPVARYGPFVMNTREELIAAFEAYQRTGFGGWPWSRPDPVHGPEPRRFLCDPNGRATTPE